MKWEQPLEAVTFSHKDFFQNTSILEQLPLSNKNFFLTKYFKNFIFFLQNDMHNEQNLK